MTEPDASRNGSAAGGPPMPAQDERPGGHAARPEPGDRPPTTRLDRPPSDRYRPAATSSGARAVAGPPGAFRGLGPAAGVAVVGALIEILVGGVLAEHRGLLAVAGISGAAIGLLAANAAVSPDGVTAAALTRRTAIRAAIAIALGMLVAAAFGIWIVARVEGGVLAPLDYLWETTGILFPAQALLATLGAAWGAGAGPVRGRS